jgi:bacillopeptidase F (M6 metalloprotease family)
MSADDLFADWAVTNFVNDPNIQDGRFAYQNYTPPFNASLTGEYSSCPTGVVSESVMQYGVDYYQIYCNGNLTIEFQGLTLTSLLDTNPYSGEYAYWSNKGDESDMTLTRSFDFSGETGPITLTYQTWYDLEEDYDYAYVEVSTDGKNWDILLTPSGTDKDLSGNSYGWGYNANSGGWIEEQVDLSEYAGKEIQLRFEYITDAAVNGEGLMVDDIRIPEIGYFEDFEQGDGGWEAAGFVRIHNQIPQTYKVTLIQSGSNGTTITPIELDGDQYATVDLNIESGFNATLVISGTTRFTRQPAGYTIQVE